MFKYTPQSQLTIFDFKTEFESKLDKNNRWVKLSNLLDWDAFAKIYSSNFSSTMGAPGVDARIIIGALIIKHIERKDDRGTIEMIAENPYMQYFLGYDYFSSVPIFDPSLFVTIRKRLGNEAFDKMSQIIISKALNISEKKNEVDSPTDETHSDIPAQEPANKGKLQMDATVADAHIKYPTDLNLLNQSREKAEEILEQISKSLKVPTPRTYKRVARKHWLNLSKKKNKSHQEIRKGVKLQINFLKRDIKSIDKLLEKSPHALTFLDKRQFKYLLVIHELLRQQEEMFTNKTHSTTQRIVSIHQPHVRPIVRGKEGRKVEFGAKINVSLQQGFARVDQLNFEAFNEAIYLKEQVENYKKLNGCYPEVVQTDDLYMNRENRNYLKKNNIRHTGRPLGRKPKVEMSKYQKRKLQQERNERNQIEGKFGQGKSRYNLNKIMAKLQQTSESWIASIFFVMNILKLSKDFLYSFLKGLFLRMFLKNNQYIYKHKTVFNTTY
jgi:hypothetical protein